MCFFGGGGSGSGPQSSADIAAGGYRPPVKTAAQATSGANPHNDAATPQGKRAAVTTQQTNDRNTMRRADSYGSRQSMSSSAQSGKNIMSALNNYNKANKKTILGS
jgi:hypothetical protein